MILARAAAALAAAFLLINTAAAQSPVLSLEGKVKEPQHWTLDDLRKMPAQREEVSFQTDRGPVTARFTGVLLWSLIEAAGGLTDTEKGGVIRHAVRVTAKDGWVVVTSTGEIAPDFGAKPALVAYERDGKPLEDFRVVMPGKVRDVVMISIE